MTLDQALGNSVGDDLGQQGDRADSVVVAGDGVLEIIGVRVGIENANNGNSQFLCLVNGEVLAQRVNDPHGTRGFLEITNTSQRLLKLGEFALFEQQLFLRKTLRGVLVVDFFEFFHATKALGHGLEVGQKTTQPTLVHVGLTHTGCLLAHRLLGLLLCSHKQDSAAVGDGLAHEVVGLVNEGQ